MKTKMKKIWYSHISGIVAVKYHSQATDYHLYVLSFGEIAKAL